MGGLSGGGYGLHALPGFKRATRSTPWEAARRSSVLYNRQTDGAPGGRVHVLLSHVLLLSWGHVCGLSPLPHLAWATPVGIADSWASGRPANASVYNLRPLEGAMRLPSRPAHNNQKTVLLACLCTPRR